VPSGRRLPLAGSVYHRDRPPASYPSCFETRPSGAGRADAGIVGEAFVYALVGGLGLTVALALAGIAASFLVRRDDATAPRPADATV